MIKKLLSALIIAVAVISVFTACTKDEGVPATQISDSDSAHLQELFPYFDSQLEKAQSAKSTGTSDAFQKALTNPDTSAAAYYGTEDITIDLPEHSDKTVSIRTSGKLTLDSTVASVVILAADGGFYANAKADSIIIKGDGIKAELDSPVGTVYVTGKDAELFIKNEEIEKVIAGNSTAVIHNISGNAVQVTLMNGTKVTVDDNQTYKVKENVLTKYAPSK